VGTSSAGLATTNSKWPVVPIDDPHPHRSPLDGRPAVWCPGNDHVIASVYYIRQKFENCPARGAFFFDPAIGELSNLSFAPVRTGCQPGVRNGGVNYGVGNPIRLDPGLNTRQHERGVNKRRQRIRTRKPGSHAKPWGFGPVSKPMIFQLENGLKSQKSKNVRRMRGLRHGDGVHKNEPGI